MELNLEQLRSAAKLVYTAMPPTPQYTWPLLSQSLDCELWVKHENHSPVGAFKIRGGLVYFNNLVSRGEKPAGVIGATRGNHGQSVGFAAKRYGIPATIVVPHGNSLEKNAAMRALGIRLLEHGDDFQEAREYAGKLAVEESLHLIPSFDPLLVAGVASYALELFDAVKQIDVAYVPIGLGSGICGMLAARNALNLKTKIVGVVSSHAPAYAHSFEQQKAISAPAKTRLADGMACSVPEPEALALILAGVDHIVAVSDTEVAAAIRQMFAATHNICEGAGAAALAAAFQEQAANKGLKVAVIASGGNIDLPMFSAVLNKTLP